MPNGNKIKIVERKLLIVEGKDEENFFQAALVHLAIPGIQVLPIGGKTKLTGNLKALKNDPAFGKILSLAVVRDADMTAPGLSVPAAQAAFDAVRGALTGQGVQLPSPTAHAQFVVGPPRVGVFIVPDGVSDGMLETLCTNSVASRPEYACVTAFFNCCQQHGVVPNNSHKAKAHAWLALRPSRG